MPATDERAVSAEASPRAADGGGADIPSAGGYRYAAFISYRHADLDRQWAKWLHRALETYRIPKRLARERGLPPRFGRVFRDEEELPASADLSRQIDTALEESRFLVVVCSPRTPGSAWVNREIERFRELGRGNRILALLIDGDPAASFPPALREVRRTVVDPAGVAREVVEPVEPLAADVRHQRRNPARRAARLRIAACLLGVAYDDLRQREQERRTRRLTAVAAGLAVLLAGTAGLAAYALDQRGQARAAEREVKVRYAEAVEQRAEADRQRGVAVARQKEAEDRKREAELKDREARTRLAESLIAQGDALGSAGRWDLALDRFRMGRDTLAVLALPTAAADYGEWDALRQVPEPMLVVGKTHQTTVTLPGSPAVVYALRVNRKGVQLWDVAAAREARKWAVPGDPAGWRPTADGRFAFDHQGGSLLLDLSSPAEPRPLSGFDGRAAERVAVSADGRFALADVRAQGGDRQRSLRLWDVRTAQPLWAARGASFGASAIALSPDGRSVASTLAPTLQNALQVWDGSDGRPTRSLAMGAAAMACAFSPDGSLIAAGDFVGGVHVWEAATGRRLFMARQHDASVEGISFSPDGQVLVSASLDKSVRLWDVRTGACEQTLGWSARVFGASFSADGRFVLGRDGADQMIVWPRQAPPVERVARPPKSDPGAFDFGRAALSRSGRLAAVVGDGAAVGFYDVATGNPLCRFPGGPPAPLSDVYFGAGDRNVYVYSAGKATAGRGVAVATGRARFAFGSDDAGCTAIRTSPDGRLLLVLRTDNALSVYDAETGQQLRRLGTLDNRRSGLAFSPDAGLVLAGPTRSTSARLWDVASGRELRTFERPTAPTHEEACRVAFSPDGRWAAGGDDSGRVFLWEVATGRLVRTLGGAGGMISQLAFAGDDRIVIAAHAGGLRVWDVQAGTLLRSVPHTGYTTGVGFHPAGPDGPLIAVAGRDGALRFLDLGFASRRRDAGPAAAAAYATLVQSPKNGDAVRALGRWYALNGIWDWAADRLTEARAAGADVPPLELARACWLAGRPGAAAAAYEAALGQAANDPERQYLTLCLAAVRHEPAAARDATTANPTLATRPAAAPAGRPVGGRAVGP